MHSDIEILQQAVEDTRRQTEVLYHNSREMLSVMNQTCCFAKGDAIFVERCG